MELPLPNSAYLINCITINKKARKIVAVLLCLFLMVGLIVTPHVIFRKVDKGNWTIEVSVHPSQVQRINFLSTAACLPPKDLFDITFIPSSKIGKTIEDMTRTVKKEWLIMYWFGSNYI